MAASASRESEIHQLGRLRKIWSGQKFRKSFEITPFQTLFSHKFSSPILTAPARYLAYRIVWYTFRKFDQH